MNNGVELIEQNRLVKNLRRHPRPVVFSKRIVGLRSQHPHDISFQNGIVFGEPLGPLIGVVHWNAERLEHAAYGALTRANAARHANLEGCFHTLKG